MRSGRTWVSRLAAAGVFVGIFLVGSASSRGEPAVVLPAPPGLAPPAPAPAADAGAPSAAAP
ncbi:MAG TPA: hypothetical protein VMS17_02530, partial [Gemmataceae bacterium]|nr:hypothetical protein [Gemmataceae bacterium]